MKPVVMFKKNVPEAVLPFYAHGEEDAGMDLYPLLWLTQAKEGTISFGEQGFIERTSLFTQFDNVQKVYHKEHLPLPAINNEDARCVTLNPNARAIFDTGLSISLPEGYEGQVRSRSGLTSNQGLVVLNAPGTIDPGYRGTLKVIILNTSGSPQKVPVGRAIAQLVIAPVTHVAIYEAHGETDATARGTQGFGSTDKA
ncbi:Dut dUTPase [uncultured Caudovirales phage]|uniref:dUTP diphosphatase n=1 Tax=uncultured Caudovirales phage TaxID=2100421 RepID=A0A6J5L147_9CAUD|nr:Dut dUTPase [uncultured Caudovirales phage]